MITYAIVISSSSISIALLITAWRMGLGEFLFLAHALLIVFLAGGFTSDWEFGNRTPWPWVRSWKFLLYGQIGFLGFCAVSLTWIRVPGWLVKFGLMSDCYAHIVFIVGGTLILSIIVTFLLWLNDREWSWFRARATFIFAVVVIAITSLISSPNTLRYFINHPWPWEWELCD